MRYGHIDFSHLAGVKLFLMAIVVLFVTGCVKEKPEVSTAPATNIERTGATSGGKVLNDFNANVVARGVCWSTKQTPTIADSKTSDGSGIGSFTSTLTQLIPNTKYYVRAFASNSEGTGYGNEVSFSTDIQPIPEVTTASITLVLVNSASSGGNVIADGGAEVIARGVCWGTSPDPTIANNKTTDGSGTGSYTSYLTGLAANTTYYVRAYATNSGGSAYGIQKEFTTFGVMDHDGNGYKTVVIGTQEWMAENLKTTSFNNGSSLPYVTDNTMWSNMTSPAYCWYNNDEVTYKTNYGALYNWYAAYSANMCPTGWHVPSVDEWNILISYLGNNEGGKLKEYGTTHWLTPNTGATNESGFTALPGGIRYLWPDGTSFRTINTEGNWCNSTQPSGPYNSIYWVHLQYNLDYVSFYAGSSSLTAGMSIRCVKN